MQVHRERGIVVLLERQDETLPMATAAIWREGGTHVLEMWP